MKRQVVSCFALSGAMLIGVPSVSAPADDESSAEGRAVIEEVIVTAQRVAQSIQDVPIAVTALTDDALRDRQIITSSTFSSMRRTCRSARPISAVRP